MKIIFLDFDGVLTIPATGFNYGHTTAIRELNRITTTINAVVVVSSTWRNGGEIR